MTTEYERLFGVNGVYTSYTASTRGKTHIRRGPYANLIEELHMAGISVNSIKQLNPQLNGIIPKNFIITDTKCEYK